MDVGEFAFDVPSVKEVTDLARTTIPIPTQRFLGMEIFVEKDRLEIWLDGIRAWSPTLDTRAASEMSVHEGTIGLTGLGPTVMFQDVTVNFLTPTQKAGQR